MNVNKARGPDSWSDGDLKQMPQSFLPYLLQLLQSFTNIASWPAAMLEATVSMLSKVDAPLDKGQTRLITTLSCISRLWSKLTAKKHEERSSVSSLGHFQGNRPGASSKWQQPYRFWQSQVWRERDFLIISLDLLSRHITYWLVIFWKELTLSSVHRTQLPKHIPRS